MKDRAVEMAGMNGTQQIQPQPLAPDTPLAYYTPVAITSGTIKWFMASVVGVIGFLATAPVAERYMKPAKDTDLQAVKAVVEIVRTEQQSSREAVARLTQAVDNLAGIVSAMKDAPPRTIERYLPAPVGKPRIGH